MTFNVSVLFERVLMLALAAYFVSKVVASVDKLLRHGLGTTLSTEISNAVLMPSVTICGYPGTYYVGWPAILCSSFFQSLAYLPSLRRNVTLANSTYPNMLKPWPVLETMWEIDFCYQNATTGK